MMIFLAGPLMCMSSPTGQLLVSCPVRAHKQARTPAATRLCCMGRPSARSLSRQQACLCMLMVSRVLISTKLLRLHKTMFMLQAREEDYIMKGWQERQIYEQPSSCDVLQDFLSYPAIEETSGMARAWQASVSCAVTITWRYLRRVEACDLYWSMTPGTPFFALA